MKKPNIFIVEDNLLNTAILKDILREKDYLINSAADAKEALEKIQDLQPDIILLDIVLPGMNGFELCKKFKNNYKTKEVPIIFISSLAENNNIAKGFAAGGIDYISKPFKKEIVLARIETQIKLYRTKKKLQEKNEKQNILLENIDTQIWYLEDIKTYGKVNKAHAEFLGLEPEELQGKCYYNFFHEEEKAVCIEGNKKAFMEMKKVESEEWVRNHQGEKRLLKITKTPKLDKNNNVEYVVASAEDITERKKEQQRIKYLSFHDELTGLYNRRYFENEINRLNDARTLPISIIVADLDNLKFINDNYGHIEGDKYIIKAADILSNIFRSEDIIARIGGDEFAVILPDTTSEVAAGIVERIKEEFDNCNDYKSFAISIGYASKKNYSLSLEEIFIQADKEMYRDKSAK